MTRERAKTTASFDRKWIAVALVGAFQGSVFAAWVQFVDETATRLAAPASLVAGDPDQKDYAWGDVDNDGDIDLVIARKEPFTTSGRRSNVLLLNEGGVLVDRTPKYAADSDVPGDQGFLTPTNDRDVQILDVDHDGWLDIVTAVTMSDGLPRSLGYPRIYVNLGDDTLTGAWRGFRFEQARIPELLSYSGQVGHNPRFCSVAVGDVSGDGYPDLWFTDGDNGGVYGAKLPAGADFNDRLLLNHGAANPGFFSDVTSERFLGSVPVIQQEFVVSNFGASGAIADINGDGRNDIVKQAAGTAPRYVGVAYDQIGGEGAFDTYGVLGNQQSAYYVSVGDLNNDDSLDMVVTNDCADRFLLNTSEPGPGTAQFLSYNFSFGHAGAGGPSSDDTFGGNSRIVDLDNDGWNDVLVTDVDIDLKGCTRRLHVYRNLGGAPGGFVNLQEQTEGAACQTFFGNPASCIVAGIPSDRLEGVHDVAVFDIDGDGFNDMVVGRCGSTEVYMQVPPEGAPVGVVPDGSTDPGAALRAGKSADGRITLDWEDSCAGADRDYEIYEGTLGSFTSHAPRSCSTSGATDATVTPGAGSHYYLVVPSNGVSQGGYGQASDGTPRSPGAGACRPMSLGDCE